MNKIHHFQTAGFGTLSDRHSHVADAPRPDEIVVIIGIADGGRIDARVGKGRVL